MKNKLILMGTVCLSFFAQTNATFEDEREDRKHAHVLVKYMYVKEIRESFESGQLGKEDRKRLREEILDTCPIAYRDANNRSFGQLLAWRGRWFLQGKF